MGRESWGQGQARQGVELGDEEARVFEDAQEGEVDGDGGGQGPFGAGAAAPAIHRQAEGVVQQGGEEHEEHVDRFAPGVKHQAGHEEHAIAPGFGHDAVEADGEGKKIE